MPDTEQTPRTGPGTTVMPVVEGQPGMPPERWSPTPPALPPGPPAHEPQHARRKERWLDYPWLLAAAAVLALFDVAVAAALVLGVSVGDEEEKPARPVVSPARSTAEPTHPAHTRSAPATHRPRSRPQIVVPPRPRAPRPSPRATPTVTRSPAPSKPSPKASPTVTAGQQPTPTPASPPVGEEPLTP